jgi:anti-sigma factor RsiW
MPDAIDGARGLLEGRIKEIESEAAKLRAALESLRGGTAPLRRPGAKPKRGGRRAAKRAPRGQRRKEFLAAVKASPGATAADLGKTIGISTNQAYALGQRLLKDGEVKKKGKGYRSA